MLSMKHLFEKELERLVQEEIERLKDVLSMGSLDNQSDYKFITGRIHGLRTTLDYMSEANSIIERG